MLCTPTRVSGLLRTCVLLQAVGWAAGVERIATALQQQQQHEGGDAGGDGRVAVVLAEWPTDTAELRAASAALAAVTAAAARAGWRVDVQHTRRAWGKQLSAALRRDAERDVAAALFLGAEEVQAGCVAVKDLATKDQRRVAVGDLAPLLRGIADDGAKG